MYVSNKQCFSVSKSVNKNKSYYSSVGLKKNRTIFNRHWSNCEPYPSNRKKCNNHLKDITKFNPFTTE